ncbi:MAG TPA: MlaD family protein [Candidatus Binatia bacterium]|jgi:ABC-type transporter Mla subunit MlaD|nr:MlaD family protein [Candidatus Binatia bacterium]
MALQDLTPQLRTRLSRMERAVGWFVIVAMGLLGFGFFYYVYTTAERKGWFLTKAPYFTFTDRATGLKVGDPVMLMGFEAGRITDIKPMPAEQFIYNVYVQFELKWPNYEYMWTDGSHAKVATADFLGKRVVEVTKGTGGYPAYVFFPLRTNVPLAEAKLLADLPKWELAQDVFDRTRTNLVVKALTPLTNLDVIAAAGYSNISVLDSRVTGSSITGIWHRKRARYDPYTKSTKPYWLPVEESAAVTERLEKVVGQVEAALPNILNLTNQLTTLLSNSTMLTSNLNVVAVNARPAVSNLAAATAQLDHPGALGEWLLPTNLNRQLETTLGNASITLTNANTNLTALVENLSRSLDNLAGITSNLNQQVETNTNLLSAISKTIIDADTFVQGLKHHWLLRSAFKTKKTNAPPAAPSERLRSPKEKRE